MIPRCDCGRFLSDGHSECAACRSSRLPEGAGLFLAFTVAMLAWAAVAISVLDF